MLCFVVTGGARGIGHSIVRTLANIPETKVFYSYRNQPDEGLDELPNVYSYKADCATFEGCQLFSKFIFSNTNHISGLVNNVGFAQFELINNTCLERWNRVHRTNADSALFMYQLLNTSLRESNGIIINISSLVAQRPAKGTGAYASSKALLEELSQQMSYEMKDSGVEVLTISPGFILSEALQKPMYENIRQKNLELIPLKRFGQTHEIARIVELMLTRQISGVSGKSVNISGGQHISSY